MTVIYAAPPWFTKSSLWSEIAPVRRSRSALDGQRFVSSAGPARRVVSLTVSALAGKRDGAGLTQSLIRLLDGGVNLVRLDEPPVNWTRDRPDAPHDLTGGAWVGAVTTSGGFDAVALTGRAPGEVVCRAFDLIGSYVAGELAATARAVRTVLAGIDGTAVIPLHSALPAGVIRVGEAGTMVAEATSMPTAAQPIADDWVFPWTFREVLTAEIPEGATEVNPW